MTNNFSGISYLKNLRYFKNPWIGLALIMAIIIALPLLIVFFNVTDDGGEIWDHILNRLLPSYITNTLILMLGVGFLTFAIGVSTAWVTSVYQFRGQRLFSWALILPISLPAYISGFTWAGILDYTSPVYVFFRNQLGIETGQYLFFDILSMPGAIIILSLALYPYVYLITRTYFLRQSASLFEVAATLGKSPISTFFQVALPLARPAIVAGISLALMEVLNDYGLVRYFGVDTFTTGIFTAWFSFSNAAAALKLSAYLMIFVLILLVIERIQRGKMRYDMLGNSFRPIVKKKLKPANSFLAIVLCMIPVTFGFLIPVIMLIFWSIQTAPMVVDYRFGELLGNSFILATIASAVIVIIALFIGFTVRRFPSVLVKFLAKVVTLGYALPGAVVAIGIIIPFLWIDKNLASIGGSSMRLALTGTWFVLIYAYLVRFMAVGYNSIESGMEKISPKLDEASLSLGKSNFKTLMEVNVPLLTGSIISAALLVFIDVLKELPLTLILRPFNFDTLAIRAFEFASDERVAEAAPASIIIVITGLIPVFFLNKIMNREK